MTPLPRFLPHPLPPVRYVPEYRAEGRMKADYEDMKSVLQVPWMGVVTMAYAHFPHFFTTLWSGMRELCGSEEYLNGALALRAELEAAVTQLRPPPIVARLRALGYSDTELDDIRAVPDMLSHGNYLYALITTAARDLLEGGSLGAGTAVTRFHGRHAPAPRVPLVLMEQHHVDAGTRAIYEDIKATLGLPFVNTDYRALARWPSYFALAWADLKPAVGGAMHESLCQLYQDRVVAITRALPNPGRLTAAALQEAAARDASPDLLPVIQLFQHLQAGLFVNVAFLRHQLLAE